MIIQIPLCMMCRHRIDTPTEHWFKCKAFPKGIPNDIMFGRHDHHQKYQGDRGITFSPKVLRDAESVYKSVDTPGTIAMEEVLQKDWSDWSKFRKPKYDPSNSKTVSACRKYAAMGIVKPGCARAMELADNMYTEGKDSNEYQGSTPVDPKRLFSQSKDERDSERQKQMALNSMDRIFDSGQFTRDAMGHVNITNWGIMAPQDKQTLASLFDERGMLRDNKHREFDQRFQDYSNRRIKRGLDARKIQ